MKKKIISLLLALAMALSLVACGGGSSKPAADASTGGEAATAEGKIINIYVWNQEFQGLFNTYYPGVERDADGNAKTSKDLTVTYLSDGTEVHWTINANQDGVYQQKLDEALANQGSAADDDKVDLFLVEADYALKYTDADVDVAVPLSELGITADDLSAQYKYTQDVVTDANGEIRGTSWQATPGLFAYRRSIAKDVFGTDDPDAIQELLSDWTKFDDAANKLKEKGYYALCSVADTYRVFGNNVSAPWVNGNDVIVDQSLMDWVEQCKKYTDEGLNHKVGGQFTDEWNSDQGADSKVFGFFYSTWGINFTLKGNAGEEGFGDWAVCRGPMPFFWGGSWLIAARGTDNAEHLKDIMLSMTADPEILTTITLETQDFTNNEEAMNSIAADPDYKSDFLAGQNHVALFAEAAPSIDMSNVSPYDQGCCECFQNAFTDYFNGQVDFDTAKANFELKIKERYPELANGNVVWPEG